MFDLFDNLGFLLLHGMVSLVLLVATTWFAIEDLRNRRAAPGESVTGKRLIGPILLMWAGWLAGVLLVLSLTLVPTILGILHCVASYGFRVGDGKARYAALVAASLVSFLWLLGMVRVGSGALAADSILVFGVNVGIVFLVLRYWSILRSYDADKGVSTS